jgi:hypothetical protein
MSGVFLILLSASSRTSAIVSAVGVSASGAIGSAFGEDSQVANVSGVFASANVSSLNIDISVNVALVGVFSTAAVSSVLIDTQSDALLQGVAAVGQISSSTNVTGNSSTVVTGILASGAVGVVAAGEGTNILIGSVSGTGQVSPALVTGTASTIASGVSGTGNIGTVSAGEGVSFVVTGVQGQGQVSSSTIRISTAVSTSGVTASGQIGSVVIQPALSVIVTGVFSTATVGSVSLALSSSVFVTGVSATANVGSVEAQPVELPEGTILFFDRTSVGTAIPTGFSLYTEESGQSITNFLIKGGSAVSRSTGSSAPVTRATSSLTSGNAGAHSVSPAPVMGNLASGPGSTPWTYYASSGGTHSHSLTLSGSGTYPASATVQGMEVPLIRATANTKKIPSNAIIFSSDGTVFSGFSRKSWTTANGVYKAASSINVARAAPTSIAPSFSISVATGGSHTHFTSAGAGTKPVSPFNPVKPTSAGDHTHTGNTFGQVGVWHQYKHLLPVVSATEQDVKPGMIVMYNGVSVPQGWLLCDGTNGTPNMVGYFVGYDNSLSTSGTLVGRDIIGSTGPTATTPAPSPTTYATSSVPISIGTATNPHNHATPNSSPGTEFQQHQLTTNPHSHPAAATTFVMPTAYTPQTLTLIFIQKAA